ncbi:MAG: hypothetical protein AAF702_20875 [Chloroflexota bacterium]
MADLHHALCNVIEPAFEQSFIHHSYANRVGKGTHRALDQAQRWMAEYPYVLQCDLRQFFPSIDHEILCTKLERRIQDGQMRSLIRRILQSGKEVLDEEYEMVYFGNDDVRGSPLVAQSVRRLLACVMRMDSQCSRFLAEPTFGPAPPTRGKREGWWPGIYRIGPASTGVPGCELCQRPGWCRPEKWRR